ncbi:glycerate dehydrogenase [Tothia fuscella]|uniref:Glycerate dehydrogenase n=1 Tax=Tothia fuscella TaxID=1048955 RepID=A0A9P4NN13_9PEZI|nr:glycerate dehydrogenase [Tothia fuscella]
MHHEIVAIEGLHSPIPTFDVSEPHTSNQTIHHNTSPSELHTRIKDATIIITTTIKLDATTLSVALTPKLQLIAVMASGTDCVDFEAAKKRGIAICNCPHAPTDVVSEHAIGLYFAARRKTVLMHGMTIAEPSKWKARGSLASYLRDPTGYAPMSCQDETCGIIGYGALGKGIEQIAKALGMKVLIAARKNAEPSAATKDTFPQRTAFTEVLRRKIKLMSPHAVLINVSRGLIVNENALLTALKEGQIAGAATDVFDVEPVGGAKDSVLLGSEARDLNLTLTPHVAWFGERTKDNLRRILKGNVEGFINGNRQHSLT